MFLSLTLFGNLSVNLYLTFLLVITRFRFTCYEKKHLVRYLQVPKYYEHIFKFSEMSLMGQGTFYSNKTYFVLIT